MTPKIIVSYDDTPNDRDALALGGAFAAAGATVALAYVRHDLDSGHDHAERQAEALLARGAAAIGVPGAALHVVVDASTPNGLRDLAARERADMVVFGSEYRTATGSVHAGTSAQRLLSGGPAAIAIAPAGLRDRDAASFRRIGVLAEPGDDAAAETARRLAAVTGGQVIEPGNGPVDLMVIGSRAEAATGQVLLSATAEYAIDTASCPVLAVPRGVPVTFRALVSH
jgi:nucleotide-binding universal stress UspA family protein